MLNYNNFLNIITIRKGFIKLKGISLIIFKIKFSFRKYRIIILNNALYIFRKKFNIFNSEKHYNFGGYFIKNKLF